MLIKVFYSDYYKNNEQMINKEINYISDYIPRINEYLTFNGIGRRLITDIDYKIVDYYNNSNRTVASVEVHTKQEVHL